MQNKNLKILGILPHSIGGRLTVSSIFDGFMQIGAQVKIIDLLDKFDVLKDKFDFIVGYGFSGIKFNNENNLNLKTINYFSDVIETAQAGSGFDEYRNCLSEDGNYSFYWDRKLFEKSCYKNLFYMPHFVNTQVYKDLAQKREFDVMFAGRLDSDYRLNLIYNLVKSLPNLKFAWYAIEKHYQDAISRVENSDIIKNIYKGFISDERTMNEALNNSKIVINMNSQGESSLNYRTFQALATKTLVLSDEREELDLFENLIPTYKDEQELINNVTYYLTNNYDNIVSKCREIIEKNHSSKVCVKKMLKLINHE